ncbi:AraC family transcriptional regulator [Actinacidiphila glaucinigra]|uniref:AraC family transcriptional regulator n=1 Tax=Actinacidiphila glaucinigra TaxID=235986 RepID=UPI0033D5D18F
MDPLSDVLSLLDLRSGRFARLEAQEPWAVGFSGNRHIKLGAVLRGTCRLEVVGVRPALMGAGDCYLIGSGREYVLRGGREVRALPSAEVFSGHTPGVPVRIGLDPDTVVVACGFDLDGANAAALLDVLPPVVHVAAGSAEAGGIRSALDLLRAETEQPALGTPFVTERLAHILLMHLLRAHAMRGEDQDIAWLTALADRHVGAALQLMHDMPAYPWSVAELATKAGLSRSRFAEKFTQAVGLPPQEYLAGLRIRSAARELRNGDSPIAAVAARWGYRSESSFSHAFKRAMGSAPGRYRAERRRHTGAHRSFDAREDVARE